MRNGHRKGLGARAGNANAAMDSLAHLLRKRERSVQEARKRLREKGYEAEAVSCTVSRALACGLLDDERFARGYIKGKLSLGWGRRRIEQELYRFGIATKNIEGYPDAFFADDEQLEAALIASSKHRSRSKNPRQAAYRFLVSKGYSSSIASAALRMTEVLQVS
ncbi:MAG: RecX family transcriptional regulator [Coriobacteriales bacterium]|jgi:regulatory protein|nr:RecX family transcriptional regulator [Coriobacteriales bacterium]